MSELQIKVEANPSADMLKYLEEELNQYNIRETGFDDFLPLAIFLTDTQGNLIAGLSGCTWGGCCEVDFLWVVPHYRGNGYGRRLMEAVEQEAARRDCHLMVLFSYTFQAPEFYQQLGYHISGIDEACPRGHRRFHFYKQLPDHSATSQHHE
jgi:GNAT superfamily N-acetyltransferase